MVDESSIQSNICIQSKRKKKHFNCKTVQKIAEFLTYFRKWYRKVFGNKTQVNRNKFPTYFVVKLAYLFFQFHFFIHVASCLMCFFFGGGGGVFFLLFPKNLWSEILSIWDFLIHPIFSKDVGCRKKTTSCNTCVYIYVIWRPCVNHMFLSR